MDTYHVGTYLCVLGQNVRSLCSVLFLCFSVRVLEIVSICVGPEVCTSVCNNEFSEVDLFTIYLHRTKRPPSVFCPSPIIRRIDVGATSTARWVF